MRLWGLHLCPTSAPTRIPSRAFTTTRAIRVPIAGRTGKAHGEEACARDDWEETIAGDARERCGMEARVGARVKTRVRVRVEAPPATPPKPALHIPQSHPLSQLRLEPRLD